MMQSVSIQLNYVVGQGVLIKLKISLHTVLQILSTSHIQILLKCLMIKSYILKVMIKFILKI